MKFKALITVVGTMCLAFPALAQEQSATQPRPVELASSVQRVVPADPAAGKPEQLVDAGSVVPQDQLVFSVSYRNNSGEPVTDLLIVNPVPASVRVAEQSAATAEVSVDGGSSWGKLSELVVRREGGAEAPASTDDITHLRWKVALIAPGEAGAVSFRATVK